MKETFIVRTEWQDAIFELDQSDRATIFENLFHFHAGNKNLINLNNLSVKLVWKIIEPTLQRTWDKYDRRVETSVENGRRGGRPRKNEKPNKPKKEPNNLKQPDSVYDNDHVHDSDSGSGNEKKSKTSSPGKPEVDTNNYLEVYNEFLQKQIGTTEQFSIAGRTALKKIRAYLLSQVKIKHPDKPPDELEKETLNAWRWLLTNFEKWDKFHKGQLKLEQINSNIINIINSIKNGTPGNKQQRDPRELATEALNVGRAMREARK